MVDALTLIQNRESEEWLFGYESREFTRLTLQFFQVLIQRKTLQKILLAERNPVEFIARFMAAIAAGCPIFLGNPNWSDREWQQVLELVQPDLIWREGEEVKIEKREYKPTDLFALPQHHLKSFIMVPTGGSSGEIRFAIHTWDTLIASVQGFTEYFQLSSVNSCCVLPLFHVSGLMQFLRSFTTGGKLVILNSYQDILDTISDIDPAEFFISLVPTQLNRLLQDSEKAKYLAKFKTVLLGGAPAWPELLEVARMQGIPLAPTYGMTETASQVVTLKSAEFLAGNNSCGRVLPHANIAICNAQGEVLAANETGIITIAAKSLALGYYSLGQTGYLESTLNRLQSDDLGFFDPEGYLIVVGRNSDKIITGGENVFPAEVEAAIRATGLVKDVCAIAVPDKDWGQVVTAAYVPDGAVEPQAISALLEDKLAAFKRPKYWIALDDLPRNDRGKINRDRLAQIVNLKRNEAIPPEGNPPSVRNRV